MRTKESSKVWNKAEDEAANFYLAFYPNHVDNQRAYRIKGQKTYKVFPDIKREVLELDIQKTYFCYFFCRLLPCKETNHI